ncbi:hypothetical protein [Flavivirga eckloniae]|uniref:Uncharacterized protein n=1 Tax=Flavivirga eckloniae TaxID=1803846 RepID=A0A2K9PPL5_9FLAO|nr:hypothetical protein [Flavivirga eckloniae]AUP78989.1 hypothetical protein C1H87_09870 [Flavivirga eckloniae]
MRHLIFIFLIVVTYSCKDNKVEIKTDPALEELVLDKGNPWLVNNETHIGITKMDALIKDFNKSKDKDYVNLGELLSKQTSYIIKKCSIKGKAHDQLHIVVIPMLDEISILKENKETAIKKAALLKLQIYINKYFQYFTIE